MARYLLSKTGRAPAKLKTPGSQAWKSSRERFTRSVIEGSSANLYGATKGFLRVLGCGRSNGRLRECLRTLRKGFTCIHPAVPRAALRRLGCAAYSLMNLNNIRLPAPTTSKGTGWPVCRGRLTGVVTAPG